MVLGNSCFAQLPLMVVTGNRSCIGRQFALLELQTLVAAVVRKVSLSAAGPLDVIQVLHRLFLATHKGTKASS